MSAELQVSRDENNVCSYYVITIICRQQEKIGFDVFFIELISLWQEQTHICELLNSFSRIALLNITTNLLELILRNVLTNVLMNP